MSEESVMFFDFGLVLEKLSLVIPEIPPKYPLEFQAMESSANASTESILMVFSFITTLLYGTYFTV